MKARLENRPSIERIREVLDYDPETGILRWKITSGRAISGREAGSFDKTIGYTRVRIDGKFLLGHHVGWAITHGYWPERLDHRYGKGRGDGIANLRECTQSQNLGNIGKPSHNTSGLKGVAFHGATGKWQAQIKAHGKRIYLGIFGTPEDAHEAYEKAALEHFGEFARTQPMPKPIVRERTRDVRPAGRPTPEEVLDILDYDRDTGIIKWKRALGFRGQVGNEAGRLNSDGYMRVGMFGKQYQAHMLAWVFIDGCWPTVKIDHVNNIRNDNRAINLRPATQSQNLANTGIGARNSSGFKGVHYARTQRAWVATIKVNGKSRYLGTYQTPEDAHESYKTAALAAWGEHAKFR